MGEPEEMGKVLNLPDVEDGEEEEDDEEEEEYGDSGHLHPFRYLEGIVPPLTTPHIFRVF